MALKNIPVQHLRLLSPYCLAEILEVVIIATTTKPSYFFIIFIKHNTRGITWTDNVTIGTVENIPNLRSHEILGG